MDKYYRLYTAIFIVLLNACGGGGGSSESALVSTDPTPPTNLIATPGDSKIYVQWDSVGGANSYNLYYATESFTGLNELENYGSLAGGSFLANQTSPMTIIGLPNGTQYYIVVTSVNSSGESPASIEASATPSFSSIPLPPDPGKAGIDTLLGIDSDGDGVRDDIQRWIAFTYPNSEITRAALTQKAILLQDALMYSDDQMLSIEVARENGRAAECLYYTNPDNAYLLATELRSVFLNTEERSVAYIRYNSQLSGQSFRGRRIFDWKASCAFDVDSMDG
ncbi:MAG: fibronectin type III domain-containing protein [Candidatus Thiodiazotropha taylori]|nr:fibronectin type III domain-containing protein [Candidatus Thiodiazotropha taylori]